MYDSWAFGNYVWRVRIFFCKWIRILRDICVFYHKTPCAASDFSGSCLAIARGKSAGKKSRDRRKILLTKRREYAMISKLTICCCGTRTSRLLTSGCSTMARAPAFQVGDAGSTPVTRSRGSTPLGPWSCGAIRSHPSFVGLCTTRFSWRMIR